MQSLCKILRLASLLTLIATSSVTAQDDDEDPYLPGLIATYRDNGGAAVNRVDRAISFSWLDRSPDRRISAGRFSADWQGFLVSQGNGSYQLHAFCAGPLRITLNDRVIIDAKSEQPEWHSSEPIDLNYAY